MIASACVSFPEGRQSPPQAVLRPVRESPVGVRRERPLVRRPGRRKVLEPETGVAQVGKRHLQSRVVGGRRAKFFERPPCRRPGPPADRPVLPVDTAPSVFEGPAVHPSGTHQRPGETRQIFLDKGERCRAQIGRRPGPAPARLNSRTAHIPRPPDHISSDAAGHSQTSVHQVRGETSAGRPGHPRTRGDAVDEPWSFLEDDSWAGNRRCRRCKRAQGPTVPTAVPTPEIFALQLERAEIELNGTSMTYPVRSHRLTNKPALVLSI